MRSERPDVSMRSERPDVRNGHAPEVRGHQLSCQVSQVLKTKILVYVRHVDVRAVI
jgi:hypothetical protein